MAVGRMGSLMHDATSNHCLPTMLKEHYGGLKRLLERHEGVFMVGDDHPYNPHVSLRHPEQHAALGQDGGGHDGDDMAAMLGRGAGGGGGGGHLLTHARARRRPRKARSNVREKVGGGMGGGQGWAGQGNGLNNVLAIDCEMVGTGQGGVRSVLARCSIVNQHGVVVYDKYVKTDEPVTDYRTSVSGIRAEHLKNATVDFATVQVNH